MKYRPLAWVALASTCLLSSTAAFALEPRSGPGMMRCTVVVGRLSSRDAADRMPLLSWAQGYLSGIAAVATAFDGTSDVDVPSYDDLKPRILAICQADPTLDLYHVARRLTARRDHAR